MAQTEKRIPAFNNDVYMVRQAKAWQRKSEYPKVSWHAFIRDRTGRITLGPSRHDADILTEFLPLARAGLRQVQPSPT